MNDDIRFTAQVNECKRAYTPEIIQKIAANNMPECFEITREAYVAMAQLLMHALDQLEMIVTGDHEQRG